MNSNPITSDQDEVLKFFLGPNHGIVTKDDAEKKIEELLDDPDNDARWEDYKKKVPATGKQHERLKWWAEKLGRQLPSPLMKAQASRLIDKWLEEHPGLESEWFAQKELNVRFEMGVPSIAFDVNEWRKIYNCKKVSDKKVKRVLEVIGMQGRETEQFMDRFFAELRRQEPDLFNNKKAAGKPQGGCLFICVAALLLMGASGMVAACSLLW